MENNIYKLIEQLMMKTNRQVICLFYNPFIYPEISSNGYSVEYFRDKIESNQLNNLIPVSISLNSRKVDQCL